MKSNAFSCYIGRKNSNDEPTNGSNIKLSTLDTKFIVAGLPHLHHYMFCQSLITSFFFKSQKRINYFYLMKARTSCFYTKEKKRSN